MQGFSSSLTCLSADLLEHFCAQYIPTFPYRLMLRQLCRDLAARLPHRRLDRKSFNQFLETVHASNDFGWAVPKVLDWCMDRKYSIAESTLISGAAAGNLELIKWSRKRWHAPLSEDVLRVTVTPHGSIEMLSWLLRSGSTVGYVTRSSMIREAAVMAAKVGEMRILRWLYSQYYYRKIIKWSHVCAIANDTIRMDIVRMMTAVSM